VLETAESIFTTEYRSHMVEKVGESKGLTVAVKVKTVPVGQRLN
jgi:hypothetical protein